jgi:hypothetical protein
MKPMIRFCLWALLSLMLAGAAQGAQLGAPGALSPDQVALSSPNMTLSWAPVPGASRYRVQVGWGLIGGSADGSCTNYCFLDTWTSDPYMVLNIDQNDIHTIYSWRVRAEADGATPGNWSQTGFDVRIPNKLPIPALSNDPPSIINTLTPTLRWGRVSSASLYTVQISTSETFTPPAACADCLLTMETSATSLITPPLVLGTQYYWRVKAGNPQAGWIDSGWAFRHNIQALPGKPTIAAPVNGATTDTRTPTLAWSGAALADHYRVVVTQSSDFIWDETKNTCKSAGCIVMEKVSGTSLTLPEQALGKMLYWYVRAEPNGPYPAGPWGAGTFTISGVAAPVLGTPANAATVSGMSPTLSWSPAKNADSYEVQLSTNPGFSNISYNTQFCTDCEFFTTKTTNTSFTPTLWLDNTTYYWRVRGKNGTLGSALAGPWSNGQFVLQSKRPALTAPPIKTPANGATLLKQSFELTWANVENAYRYQVQVATSPNFITSLNDFQCRNCLLNVRGENVFLLPELILGTTYYWRVRAYGNGSQSAWSDSPWSNGQFTIQASGVKMATPAIITPKPGSTIHAAIATLSWSEVEHATSYRILVAETPDIVFDETKWTCQQCIINDTSYSGTYTTTALALDKTYYWQVRANDKQSLGLIASDWSKGQFALAIKSRPLAMLSPTTGSAVRAPASTLQWADPNTINATDNQYRMLVSLDANINFDESNNTCTNCLQNRLLTTKSLALSDLKDGQLIYWQGRIESSSLLPSEWRSGSFSVRQNLPTTLAIPQQIAPQDESEVANGPLSLSWQAVPNAKGYMVQVSLQGFAENEDSDACSHCSYNQYHAAVTTIALPDPAKADQVFYWRVRAVSNDASIPNSGWSSAAFRTAPTQCISMPTSTAIAVGNGAGNTTLTINAAANCNWSVLLDDNWLKLTGSSTRSGNAALTLSFQANNDINPRTAVLNVGNVRHTLVQAALPVADDTGSLAVSGVRDDYTITKTNEGYVLIDNNGIMATQTATRVKRIFFNDVIVELDVGGNAGKAFRLYQAAFDRKPDRDGIVFWSGVMDLGNSPVVVAAEFLKSAEFKSLYGSTTSNTQLITLLYQHVLHRAPDPGGLAFWKAILDKDPAATAQVLVEFSESAENKDQTADSVKNGIDMAR